MWEMRLAGHGQLPASQHRLGGHEHLAVVAEGEARGGGVELERVRLLHLAQDL